MLGSFVHHSKQSLVSFSFSFFHEKFGQLMSPRLGTGNGMAKSLLDSVGEPCKVSNAVLAIIRGCLWYLSVYYCCLSPTLIFWLNKFLHVKFTDRA